MIGKLMALAFALQTSQDAAPDPNLASFNAAWAGKVKSVQRAYFHDCQEISIKCRRKAYLIPGDVVVVERIGQWAASVKYLDAKGAMSTGYIALSALTRLPPPKGVPLDWGGAWEREEADIRIRTGSKPNEYAVTGFATWGAHDTKRIKSGGVNMGALKGGGTAAGSMMKFSDAEIENCTAKMRLVGPYMLVYDNGFCGGMNVTFSGLYRRSTPKRKA